MLLPMLTSFIGQCGCSTARELVDGAETIDIRVLVSYDVARVFIV